MNNTEKLEELVSFHDLYEFECLSACIKGIHYLALEANKIMRTFTLDHSKKEMNQHFERFRKIYELAVIEASYVEGLIPLEEWSAKVFYPGHDFIDPKIQDYIKNYQEDLDSIIEKEEEK